MIEIVWTLLRLAAGLGSIELAGYALLVLVLPRRASFTSLERLSLAFGLGSLGITLWMLALTFFQVTYSLAPIFGPWLLLAFPGGWLAWKRGWGQEESFFGGRGAPPGDFRTEVGFFET